MLQPEQPWASNRPPTARHWIESAVVAVRTDPRDCSQSFMQAHQSSADESSLDPHPADRSGRLRRYWQWCRRPLAALFLLAVIVLIVHYGASIEWRKVWESIRKIDRTTLLIAAGCAAGSHLVYACVDYPTVLAVFALAAIAGSAAHVPGGLGVTEGVFFALLGGRIPHPILFAALFTYRALYYLVPLAMALLAYLLLESGGKTRNLPLSTTAI
jgi:uncharacterized membrane protein YbhN (UPF0104 family)